MAAVGPREALAICRMVNWEELRLELRQRDPHLAVALSDLWAVGLQYDPLEESVSDVGSTPGSTPEVGAQSEQLELTTREVANIVGVTPEAVRAAARSNRLEGRLATSGWLFTYSAALSWATTRRQTHG